MKKTMHAQNHEEHRIYEYNSIAGSSEVETKIMAFKRLQVGVTSSVWEIELKTFQDYNDNLIIN